MPDNNNNNNTERKRERENGLIIHFASSATLVIGEQFLK